MNKKLIGIVAITIFILGISLVQPAMAQRQEQKYTAKLEAIGFIRIDSSNNEIKGFVLVGNNAGEMLFLKKINIKYDGSIIFVTHPLPLLFQIKYTPAK